MESLATMTGNSFHLNRRGYLYVTGASDRIPSLIRLAREASSLGAGPLRLHQGTPGEEYIPATSEGFLDQPEGIDLLLDQTLIRKHFPYLSKQVLAALHARRAGWFSAHQLGMVLLDRARAHGTHLQRAKVVAIHLNQGKVSEIQLDNGQTIATRCFINAAGPFIKQIGLLLNVDLPVYCETHMKVAIKDHLGVLPRDAPLIIWNDPQVPAWTDEEREILAGDPGAEWMLAELPAGAHIRPEGGTDSQIVLLLWDYHNLISEPSTGLSLDPYYPDLVLRGLATMIPGLRIYYERPPRPILDGGYYTKTIENRPLICPLPVPGAFVIGALSGYGLMAACAAGELLAAHISCQPLPPYAAAFSLERYSDTAYQLLLADWGESGQL
jgi:glycine/D-amino acid oxidase-like deaminating enzyme